VSDFAAPVRDEAPATRQTRFDSLDIAYDERVLEPRHWTAHQASWAVELLQSAPSGPILELCCGAGQIGLLTARLSGRPLIMVDRSEPACAFARANAYRAGLSVEVRHGPMEVVLDPTEQFAMVVADPPWVPSPQTTRFPEDPISAIDGGTDGLAIARICLMVIERHLSAGGSAVLQVGPDGQAQTLQAELTASAQPVLRIVGERSFGTRGVLLHLERAASP